MMRRASTCLALLGFGVLGVSAGLPAVASAAPVVTLKAAAVPIPVNPSQKNGPTFSGTGNILGAGAAIETEYRISGTEYGGFASPLTQVKVVSPAGFKVNSRGFATCSEATLKEKGPGGCPKKSFASGLGEAGGVVSFGTERVHETVTVQGVFGPGGTLLFYVAGTTPVSIEIISKASVTNVGGHEVVTAEVPLIESVPGALDGSAEFIKVKVGAAYKKGNKLHSYVTLPKTCPKGGFPVKTELTYLSGEKSVATYTAPCPRRKK
jgi:hypothetical protein